MKKEERDIILFSLSGQKLALEIQYLREIVPIVHIEKVVGQAPGIIGTINYRGNIIPIIQLDFILDLPQINISLESLIFIMEIEGERFGFLVDSVIALLSVPFKEIENLPKHIHMSQYITQLIKLNTEIVYMVDSKALAYDIFKNQLKIEHKSYTPPVVEQFLTKDEIDILQSRSRDLATQFFYGELKREESKELIIFTMHNGNIYGLSTEYIAEVSILKQIFHFPNQTNFIKGVTLIREEVISILDITMLLKESLSDTERGDSSPLGNYIIILNLEGGRKFGFIVDTLLELIKVSPQEIQPLDELFAYQKSKLFLGALLLKEKVIHIINPNNVIEVVEEFYKKGEEL